MSAVTLGPDDAVELAASARIRHRTAGRVDSAVLGWCDWYTADLPDAVAVARRAEIASDLFEEREHSGVGATGSILGRALRGIPADLAWRGARLRRAAIGAPRGTFPRTMPALAHLAALALVGWGGLIVWRVARRMVLGGWHGAADVAELSVVGLLLAVVGSWLLVIARRRAVAGLLLAVAAYLLVRFGTYALMETSVSFTAFFSTSTAQMMFLNRIATGAAVVFFLSIAAWWSSPREIAEADGASR